MMEFSGFVYVDNCHPVGQKALLALGYTHVVMAEAAPTSFLDEDGSITVIVIPIMVKEGEIKPYRAKLLTMLDGTRDASYAVDEKYFH